MPKLRGSIPLKKSKKKKRGCQKRETVDAFKYKICQIFKGTRMDCGGGAAGKIEKEKKSLLYILLQLHVRVSEKGLVALYKSALKC